jgi:hypothetical protein
VAPVLSALEELRGRVSQFELNDTREGRELALTVEFPQSIAQSAVAGRLGRLPNVRAVRWPED